MGQAPDILFFISDQHDARRMGWAGDEIVRTPHMDAMAAAGTACTAAYCNSPLCVPSRCALMSGQLPSRTGIFTNGGELPADVPTMGHLMGAAGYRTTLCGRMHFHIPAAYHGFDRQLVGDITAANWGHGDFTARSGPVPADLRCAKLFTDHWRWWLFAGIGI